MFTEQSSSRGAATPELLPIKIQTGALSQACLGLKSDLS